MKSQKIQQNNPLFSDEVMQVNDVVALTGYSKKYIYKLTSTSKIPYNKTPNGRKLFFIKSKIMEWLQAVEFQTEQQILNN